jgi:hypothetical protein
MTLKRTDLEKMMERKLTNARTKAATPDRFAKQSGADGSQRKPGGLMGALLKKTEGEKK